jgi:hypothetical protein
MAAFFEAERTQAGWRFGFLWIVMTLIVFIPSVILEWFVFGMPNLYIAVPMAGIAQGWVLNRHISIYIPWAGSTAIAWWIGALATRALLGSLLPEANLLLELGIVTVTAGILAGILQWFFVREWLPSIGIWWIIIGAISWQLPGVVSGLVLTPFVTYDKVDMNGKRFVLSKETAATGEVSQVA